MRLVMLRIRIRMPILTTVIRTGMVMVIPTIGVTRTTPITHIITRRTTVTMGMGMGTRRSSQDGVICASAVAERHALPFPIASH